jgi:hypothetical protein
MPALEERISESGPLITVAIGPTSLQATAARAAGISPPLPELALALIDTGAGVTCIDAKIARDLDLRRTGTARMWTAGGEVVRSVYDVELSFTLPRLFRVPAIVRAHEADLWVYGVHMVDP